MSLPRLVNLLDDFALGGVSRGLGIFGSAPVRAVSDASVAAISPKALIAPKLKAQIIVTHFPPNWRRLAFLASLRLSNPGACILHVEHSYTRNWEAANAPERRRFRLMLRLALRWIDHVVCVSHAQADWLREATGVAANKVDVIYPFSDNPGLDNLPLPDFSRPRPLKVGTYGRFHPAKGFERLIDAYRAGAMPGTEILIGGYGDLEDMLRARAGDAPGIHFVGKVESVADFVGQCDIIAVPSRWEAYGQVANEARQGGRPIFVSSADGLPEQVGEAGLILNYSSPQAVRDVFANLDRAQLRDMAAAGRAATAHCGLLRQQQWADLIQRLAASPAHLHWA